ncbi:MAG: 16S rRNA (guanine(527)-N(7))-methyltransferase RsmG [Endomicrobiales bacterium]|nr:16S rRNA (guanine(527)-N(7))-methyltransferase RsmG [Endomicrobiales bacterium]
MQNIWHEFKQLLNSDYNINISDSAVSQLKIYLNELREWNKKFNLISGGSEEEIIWRHFFDSIICNVLIKEHFKLNNPIIVDIGTGAGFPGLAAKIANPGINLTLIDSVKKKCSFLEHIINKLKLTNIKVLSERAELLGQNKEYRNSYDFVLSRALCKFSPNLELALPFLKTGGFALIYKTENTLYESKNKITPALEILGGKWIKDFVYTIPDKQKNYAIIILEKINKTPDRYPRKSGIPQKRPL